MPRSSSKKTTKKTTRTRRATTKKTTKKTSKKTAKKVATKTTKQARKRTAKKAAPTARVLVCAHGENCFWVRDGAVLQDLRELAAALESMTGEVFRYHATGEQNDFANWVELVLADADCAHDLHKARSQRGAHKVVTRYLAYYV